MKKCGRFVAGIFGTSLSLAMLSGAFLMASKGAVEAEAAGDDIVISLSDDNFDLVGSPTVLKATVSGVDFEGKFKTASSDTSANKYGFLMINNGYLANVTAPEGYFISKFDYKQSNNSAAGGGYIYVSFGGEAMNSVKTSDYAKSFTSAKGGSGSVTNEDTSLSFANLSVNAKNVQIAEATFTFSPIPETIDVSNIEISGDLSKKNYFVGDSFSTEGLTVTAYNSDKSESLDVTDDVIWTTDVVEGGLTADDTSVKVTATYGELTATKDFAITVAERPVFTTLEATGIVKTSYKIGEKLDTAGLVVTAKTADGSDSYVVPASEYTIDKTEFTIDDAVAGKATITVTYGELKATFDVNVSAMSVAEFRALSDGQSGVLVGTVTGMFSASSNGGKNLYVHDANGVGLMVYGIYDDTDVTGDVAVGKKVLVSASKTVYNGVTEAEDVVKVIVVGEGEVTPIEIKSAEDFTDDKEGSYVKMTGITHKSGSIVDGKYNANVVVTFDGQDFYMSVQNNQGAVDLANAGFDEWIEKIEGLPFDYVGSLGWIDDSHNKIDELGLAPTSMSEFSCPAYDEILNFINTYMHMDQWVGSAASGDNQCLTLFPVAKEALEKLSEAQQTYFLTSDNPEIAEAQARYKAWEAAQGDQNAASVIMNTVNENKGAIIAVSAVAALGVAGAAALLIGRKKRSAKNK